MAFVMGGGVRRRGFAWLRYVMLATVLVFAAVYIIKEYQTVAAAATITVAGIILLVILNILTIGFESLRFNIQMARLGQPIRIGTSWHLFTVMQAVNHLIPKAGTISGGYYIARRYGVSFHDYIVMLIPYIFIQLMAAGVLGLLVAGWSMLSGHTVPWMVAVMFAVLVAVSLLFFITVWSGIPRHWMPSFLRRSAASLKDIYSDRRFVARMVSVDLGYFLMSTFRFLVAMTLFSRTMYLLDGMVVLAAGNFLRVITIVPGGLGIAEVASAWVAGLMGANAFIAGVAAGLDRVVYLVLVVVFGGIGFFTLSGRSEFHRPPPGTPEEAESEEYA